MQDPKVEDRRGDDPDPRGIGGWLILSLLGLVASLVRMAYDFVTQLAPALNEEVWEGLTTPGSPAYHPLWSWVIGFEVVSSLLLIAAGLAILALFLRKHRFVPRLMIAWLVAWPAGIALDYWISGLIPEAAALQVGSLSWQLFCALTGSVPWILYFILSRRVANTFVR